MNAADIRENLKSRFWGLPEKIAIWLEQFELPNPAITISTRGDDQPPPSGPTRMLV